MARPKSYQRGEVIGQALKVFWEKGYAASSLSDLMTETGLNKRSLYNEFGNKEELFLEALARYQELRRPVVELLLRQPQGMNNIHDLLRTMAEHTDPRGCLIALSLSERKLLSENVLEQVMAGVEGLRMLVKANIDAANLPESVNREALTCLISMQSFTIAGMGKLEMERSCIKAAVEQLIALLPIAD
ncbi:hypothetical protein EOPP23_00385 [Endozoicomonas sp. OPT23]|uniref:TetR/AcrR family transcriptional regulator n=1 Tax=Endozoicomonas sp. OPT23 TaxID=2072845 RepID=UPI00129AC459|nr:TetR/AcrR family transcriptional regulator [Endozoicomonas sp. OPT23]MRI31446.1 hypothetical protein [Endozoicomonas sp. OPT23]